MNWQLSLLIIAALLVDGCGRQDDERKSGASTNGTLADDAEIQEGAFEASIADAAQTLADSSQTSETLALQLAAPVAKETQRDQVKERACVKNEDGTVTATVSATVDRSVEMEGPVRAVSRTVTGFDSLSRTWASDTLALDCAENDRVEIDWHADLAGLKLTIDIDRSRKMEGSMENKRKGTTVSTSKTFTVDGSRSVSWLTHEDLAETSEIKRTKEVSSSVEREHAFVNVKGETKTFSLTVATASDAPLAIAVLRDAETLALKEKTINSGTLVATKAGDGRIETTFDAVKFAWTDDSCAVESGKVTSHVYAEGNETPVKSFELTVTDGAFTLVDLKTGEEIADFDLPECSSSDFKL